MRKYQLANNITGWVVFAIAAVVYLMTIEPTASFWDCGEFIASAVKLEVGHPPGAPIFMLMGNLASHFTSDVTKIPMMLNALSAIFSALTILFLFWTITHLVKHLLLNGGWRIKSAMTDTQGDRNMTMAQLITVLGSGVVGALAYTFSDTFWFSAVEGEVYAFSSLMTAVVFWLILKWEDVADEPHSDRWIILIAYLMGISVAIHLLNLLCIPAIVLVYYFRKYKNPNLKGAGIALLISFGILIAILYGLVQGLVEVAGWFELLFVNSFHLPYNSGVVFYLLLVFGILGWAIWETQRNEQNPKRIKISFILAISLLGIPFLGNGLGLGICIILALTAYLFWSKKVNSNALNTILIGLLVITIGYSSYALIIVRSLANTPMDQNSPEDVFTLREYLSREQYGETPLFYGQTFVSEVKYEAGGDGMMQPVTKDLGPIWAQVAKRSADEKDRYFAVDRKKEYVYVEELSTLFPRMYSSQASHIQGYKDWSNFHGKRVRVPSTQGSKWVMKPTFGENLRYFFSYQVNFMYWRYFMWNFAGRQNDIQGHGEITNGNWISGIPILDAMRVGPQKEMPDFIAKNKGHNKYYLLPLLLGIIGIFFQVYAGKKGSQQFWITFLLFFMTGLAIVLYLNQWPHQPRERDYAYAGSFYAFAIWIGLGTAGVIKALRQYAKLSPTIAAGAGAFLCVLIPIQMVSQTWDDHDRSGRYVARDFGKNYLDTCEPNAIIFTNGDNDTFPLWYAQEVEGYRTDVRVCNLSYLQTDWYIDQMKRPAYESTPLPIDWKQYEYAHKQHEVAYIFPQVAAMLVDQVLDRIKSDNPQDKLIPRYGVSMDNIPTDKILIPVDKEAVLKAGLITPEQIGWIPPYLLVDLGDRKNAQGQPASTPKQYLGKQELMVLDMLKNNTDWSRPIYIASSVGPENYQRLEPYFRQDGAALRIMPYETMGYQVTGTDTLYNNAINSDVLYNNLMNKYHYGNMEQKGLYLDENCIRMARNFRGMFCKLATQLIQEGDTERAEKACDYALKSIPNYNVPYDFSVREIANAYHQIGKKEKADAIYTELMEMYLKNLNWYNRLSKRESLSVLNDMRVDAYYGQVVLSYFSATDPHKYNKYLQEYMQYTQRFQQVMENTPGLNYAD